VTGTPGDRTPPLPARRSESAGPAAQICFPQAVDGSTAVPGCPSGGQTPEFTSLSLRHPQRRSMSSPGYPQRCPPGRLTAAAARSSVASRCSPGRRLPSLPGKGATGQHGTAGFMSAGFPPGNPSIVRHRSLPPRFIADIPPGQLLPAWSCGKFVPASCCPQAVAARHSSPRTPAIPARGPRSRPAAPAPGPQPPLPARGPRSQLAAPGPRPPFPARGHPRPRGAWNVRARHHD
jgi:hypothetical protein